MEHDDRGRSPRTPGGHPTSSKTPSSCPNFCDPSPTPCDECRLMHFVPENMRDEQAPCRFIPINDHGHTIDDFYRTGTQVEMEEALAGWLRAQITRIEQERAVTKPSHQSA